MTRPTLIVFVPGALYIRSPLPPLQRLIIWLYGLTNIKHPIYTDYNQHWLDKLEKHHKNVIAVKWPRGVSPLSIHLGRRRLVNIIQTHPKDHIAIVGISLGGKIILDTMERIRPTNVEKIILTCSTHSQNHEVTAPYRITNIYSEADTFAKLAIGALEPFFGGQPLCGDAVTNIVLPDMTHDEMCSDSRIKEGVYQGQYMSDLVESLL